MNTYTLQNVKEASIEPTLAAFANLRRVLHDNGMKLNEIELNFSTLPPTPENPHTSAYFVVGVFVPVEDSSPTNVS